MQHEHELSHEPLFPPLNERYARIERANHESFVMTTGSELTVLGSLHSVGPSRELLNPAHAQNYPEADVEAARKLGRAVLAGNMSAKGVPERYGPRGLSDEAKLEDANRNVEAFLTHYEIERANVRMLRPERDYTTPLTVVNLDAEPLQPDEVGLLTPDTAGDFMYTLNDELALAARPADCPISFITAETPQGKLTALLHLASLGVAHGYVSQAKEALDQLGVDWSTVQTYITPGGHAESYQFTNFDRYNPHEQFPEYKSMYTNLVQQVDEAGEPKLSANGKPLYSYGVDVAAEVYERIVSEWDIYPTQAFLDTTDTTSMDAGTSSNSRSYKTGDNTRDLYIAYRKGQ